MESLLDDRLVFNWTLPGEYEPDEVLDAVDLLSPTPLDDGPTVVVEGLPLDEWYVGQAGWYRQLETETAELVADQLELLAKSCRFHDAKTPGDLVARSGRYRRRVLGAVSIGPERRCRLAELLEVDAADFLTLGTDAGQLAAFAILTLAAEADALGASSASSFAWLKAAFEAACESLSELN